MILSKRITLAALALGTILVFRQPAMAAPGKTFNMQKPGIACKSMAGKMDLTDAQKVSLKSIRQSCAHKIKAVRDDNTLSVQDKAAKVSAIRKSTQAQLKTILTPAQQQKMAGLRAKGPGHGQFGAKRGGKFAAALDLTNQQKSSIKSIMESAAQQVRAISADKSLSAQDTRAKVQAIRKSAMEQMMSVLTPAQQQKMEQFRAGAKGHKRGMQAQ